MPDSILYVSRSLLTSPTEAKQLADIQFVSVSRNSLYGVTGVLISTPDHFAQYMEGDVRALDAVMSRIRVDRRHTRIFMADAPSFKERLFPAWRMARFGAGAFVNDHVRPLIERHGGRLPPSAAREMITMMRRLVSDFHGRPPWL